MKSFKKIPFVLGLMAMAASASAQKSSGFHVTGNFPIKSNGGWDYITVDGPGKRLFVSHASQVNVLSLKGDSVGVIPATNGVHGIALVPELKKGYTSNGKDNNCTVFDLATLKPLAQIPVGTNPDAIFYDESTKKVYVFNGRSMDASVIDPATDNVIATIPLGGKPEAGVSDGKGHVFVNLETTNEVVKIDSKTYKVAGRYKLEGGEEPSGLAIDRTTNRLFVGCGGNGQMLVVNSLTGKTMAKFKIGDCDGVAFDPALKLAFSSNREGTLSVVQEVSADKFVQLANVATELSARTLALDPSTHKIYLPAAKVEEVKATADNPKARPHQISGTFHVIEVSK